jgi:hypothetical protein
VALWDLFFAAELGYRLGRAVLTDAIESKEVQMCLRVITDMAKRGGKNIVL